MGHRRIFDSLRLIIGLFCYGTYSYNDLFINFLAKRHGIIPSNISKIDLDTEKLRVYVNGELKLEVHRHELHRYLRKSCREYRDFTNRLADLSLGGVGSPEGWTTVLIRTNREEEVFNDAVRESYVRANDLPQRSLEMIKELATLKFQKGATI